METLLKVLCNFLLDDFASTKQEFRNFKDHFNGQEHVSASCDNIFRTLEQHRLAKMKRLYSSSMIIPVSNAECERDFSILNITYTDVRSILSVKHLSSLMFISIEGPPLKEFQPNEYAKEWVNAGRKSADCKEGPCRKEKKSTETKYFLKFL